MKSAVISGVTGQDGSYLSELLLSKGYKVHGIVRRASSPNCTRIQHLIGNENFVLHQADILDPSSLVRLLSDVKPDEVYNLAAQSFVPESWLSPISTTGMTALGVLHFLEAIRSVNNNIRFYQASSSEMFGKVQAMPQTETTPFYPRSPYGVSKVYGHWITVNYRESFNLFACSGILFNHESPRRGFEFVTRKISSSVAKIKLGKLDRLKLGNVDAVRDWGFAGDYVKAMWMMLQADSPDDYVIATGVTKTVRDFVNVAFAYVGLDPDKYVEIDNSLFRPAEVNVLCGDPSKAKSRLGWSPETNFESLVEMMVSSDLKDLGG